MLTFLLSDIEASTERWRRYGEAMGTALARHDEILETVILEHGGRGVKNTGDGMF
jgi:class 3 adenylate cyclase